MSGRFTNCLTSLSSVADVDFRACSLPLIGEAPPVASPRSQLHGLYTEAEIPCSSRRCTKPREVLVVLVESLKLVEDSARDSDRERRRGVQQGVKEGVDGAEKGIGEGALVGVLMLALL